MLTDSAFIGMRPGELLKMKTENVNLEGRYMIGGSKTKAGRGRIIPIHDDIFPLVEKRVAAAGEYLVPYKSVVPPTLSAYRTYMHESRPGNTRHKTHAARWEAHVRDFCRPVRNKRSCKRPDYGSRFEEYVKTGIHSQDGRRACGGSEQNNFL